MPYSLSNYIAKPEPFHLNANCRFITEALSFILTNNRINFPFLKKTSNCVVFLLLKKRRDLENFALTSDNGVFRANSSRN